MLRILYDDFDQNVKNIHDEMDLHHSYKKKEAFSVCQQWGSGKPGSIFNVVPFAQSWYVGLFFGASHCQNANGNWKINE